MANKRTDKRCVRIDLCVENSLSDAIETYQAQLRIERGLKCKKPEAAEMYFTELHRLAGSQVLKQVV